MRRAVLAFLLFLFATGVALNRAWPQENGERVAVSPMSAIEFYRQGASRALGAEEGSPDELAPDWDRLGYGVQNRIAITAIAQGLLTLAGIVLLYWTLRGHTKNTPRSRSNDKARWGNGKRRRRDHPCGNPS